MNNKMIKGSVAGATGIVLLVGGFGTYALWSDSATLPGSSVTSGELGVVEGSVTWEDQNFETWSETDLMVPGDTVTRTQDFDFTATGKNMEGTIQFTPGAITDHDNAAVVSPPSGPDAFSVVVDVTGITGLTGAGGCYEFESSNVSETATTTVTYTLDADNLDLQDVTAAIADSTFVIEQGGSCPVGP